MTKKRRKKQSQAESEAYVGCTVLFAPLIVGFLLGLRGNTVFALLFISGIFLCLWYIQRVASNKKFDLERLGELQELSLINPVDFEDLIGQLFIDMGYTVKTTATTGDEGIDLFVQKDGFTEIVQCKRFKGTIGAPIVRDLYGALIHTKARKAYLVTTGHITQPARVWAAGKPIELIDGTALMNWIEKIRASQIISSTTKNKSQVSPLIAASVFTFSIGFVVSFISPISLSPNKVVNTPRPTLQHTGPLFTSSPTLMPTKQATRTPQSTQPPTYTPSFTPQASNTPRVVPSSTFAPITYYVKSDGRINIRTCPRLECDILTAISPGTPISVIDDVEGDLVSGSNQWRQFIYNEIPVYIHSVFTSRQPQTDKNNSNP